MYNGENKKSKKFCCCSSNWNCNLNYQILVPSDYNWCAAFLLDRVVLILQIWILLRPFAGLSGLEIYNKWWHKQYWWGANFVSLLLLSWLQIQIEACNTCFRCHLCHPFSDKLIILFAIYISVVYINSELTNSRELFCSFNQLGSSGSVSESHCLHLVFFYLLAPFWICMFWCVAWEKGSSTQVICWLMMKLLWVFVFISFCLCLWNLLSGKETLNMGLIIWFCMWWFLIHFG